MEITYGDLRDGAKEFAAGLIARGLQTGEPVIVTLPTGEDYFRAFFGVLLAGGIPVPFARLLAARAGHLRAVVTPEDLKGAVIPSHLPSPAPGDTAFIRYASGNTGDPKGVVLSHANLLANIRAMGERMEVTPDDVFVS